MNTRCELECGDGVATITLHPLQAGRPPTLEHGTLDRLAEILGQVENLQPDLRLVILRSAAPKYFCVGADVEALRQTTAATIGAWVEKGHRVFGRLESLPVPTVAWVEGYALGGGLELAMACDLIYASNQAQFGQPEGRLGFVAGWGGSWRLPARIGGSRAKLLFYSGRAISAADAFQQGLADAVGTGEEIAAALATLAAEIKLGSPLSAREHKRLVAGFNETARARAVQAELSASERCLQAPDTQSRLQQFLNRKKS